jgi:hypothetical protein
MEALAGAHDAAVQMIDDSIVRVHQHTACVARSERQSMGRRLAFKLLSRLRPGSILLADRGYDADWIRTLVCHHGAWANIPPKRNRT